MLTRATGHPALNQPGQPPQYAGAYAAPNHHSGPPPQSISGYGGRVEVEGSGRSKAQLIVGIDFVRLRLFHCCDES